MTDIRLYEHIAEAHFQELSKMLFLEGPRQVGKTTIGKRLQNRYTLSHYFNWDNIEDQKRILAGATTVAKYANLGKASTEKKLIIFDEIHKFPNWKIFIKGFFDTYREHCDILITGSSKLGVYRRGGDSLMGRYFTYQVHPFTVGECLHTQVRDTPILPPKKLQPETFKNLIQFGGFPEPFLNGTERFHRQWKQTWFQQLFKEELRDVSKIQNLAQIQILAEQIQQQSGQLCNYSTLSKHIQVSVPTIKQWIEQLSQLHYCFTIKPWSNNLARALVKQPKIYCTDWSDIKNEGQRFENMMASHLKKPVDYWNDHGLGEFDLHFVRDKTQREVDFLISKDQKPWILIEAKLSDNQGLSKALFTFQEKLGATHAFQVCQDMAYINKDCFEYSTPVIVPALTFLSQLV